jgi:methylated-DNA-[protein]-cysteine S-methyltransferase
MTHTRYAQGCLDVLSSNFESNSSHIKDEVYKMLLKIPAGKVSTYGDIAKALGYPKAARLIGRILHENPNPVVIPCHRIVHSNGDLGGYAYGSTKKRKLLEKEGIKFSDNDYARLKEFQKCRISWPVV